ncbi:MAG: iron chelate uptake ABC transporter family permease subunit, partial [Pseudonocardia sp.]|nr:iron chelate uptake ABC transporter family permease subunit [Pseudonocardia sp.]
MTPVPGRPALRAGRFSVVWRPRTVAVLVGATLLLFAGLVVNIGRGDFPISIPEVAAVLLGGGDRGQRFIVLDLRLPQSLTGALVGGALAVSGAITQAVARNPLASPDIIGITMGASATAVFVIVLGGRFGVIGTFLASVGLPLAALIGGLVTAAVIYGLSWRRGIQGFRLVLVGIGINAMLLALVQWLLVVAEIYEAAQATVWLTGSLNARGWEHVVPVGLALLVLVPA